MEERERERASNFLEREIEREFQILKLRSSELSSRVMAESSDSVSVDVDDVPFEGKVRWKQLKLEQPESSSISEEAASSTGHCVRCD